MQKYTLIFIVLQHDVFWYSNEQRGLNYKQWLLKSYMCKVEPHTEAVVQETYICLNFSSQHILFEKGGLTKCDYGSISLPCLHRYILLDRSFTVDFQKSFLHSSNTLKNPMLKSKSSCPEAFDFTANSSGWRLPVSLLHICYASHKAEVHRHCLAAFIPTCATLPTHSIIFFHLYSLSSKKHNLQTHDLLFPIVGHQYVLHLLCQVTSSTEKTLAAESVWGSWGTQGNAQPKTPRSAFLYICGLQRRVSSKEKERIWYSLYL